MERGLGPITTRKVKTLRGSGLRTIQPGITFPHLNPTLHGPSMTNVIGNLPYLDQTAKILMIGMKKPNHGTKPKLKKFLQSASHFARTRVPSPQDLSRPTAFSSLKKPTQIVDTMPIATPQGTLDFKSVDKVTFVGASSNTVIDTTTGSLGVGVGVGGPTSNLHVVGHTRLEGDINMLHTSNTASIKLNSNVVTEFPRSKKLIKYPRVAMTQNDESGTSGYVASASATNPTRDPYRAFDNVLYSSWHEPVYQVNPYPNFDGAYTGGSGTVYDTNGYQGEYLQIQLPEKIKLYNYSISNRAAAGIEGRQPKDAKIFASNDGTTWIDIHTHSDGGGTYDIVGETRSFQLDNITETHYKYYRLVINSIIQGGTSDTANISQWKLYGVPEYDPEAHGTDVVVKSVPNVPNTDWLDIYIDGQDYTSMPSGSGSVLDKSTNNRHGTPSNVTFNSTWKAFEIESASTSNITVPFNSTGGAYVHTIALWFLMDTTAGGNRCIFTIRGSESTGKQIALIINQDTTTVGFKYDFYSSDVRHYDPSVVANKWMHVALTYSGGNNSTESKEIYFNGVKLGVTVSGTSPLNLTGTENLIIGGNLNSGNASFEGMVANFRMFNRVLTSDEIWQLYAYQKEYFGHGDLGMTLKAGRLGIGTSEPRAMLDVRGDILGGCPAAFSVAYNPTSLSGNQTIIWNLVYHNVGDGYNSSDGFFTAPVSGYYHFTVWGMTSGSASGTIEFQFMKNGSTVQQRPYGQAGGNYGNATGSIIEYLNIGNTMSIFLTNGTTLYAASAQSYNGFSGFYLSS